VIRSPVAEEGTERGGDDQGRHHHGEVEARPPQEGGVAQPDLLQGDVERAEERDVAEGHRPVDQQPEERQHADQVEPRRPAPGRWAVWRLRCRRRPGSRVGSGSHRPLELLDPAGKRLVLGGRAARQARQRRPQPVGHLRHECLQTSRRQRTATIPRHGPRGAGAAGPGGPDPPHWRRGRWGERGGGRGRGDGLLHRLPSGRAGRGHPGAGAGHGLLGHDRPVGGRAGWGLGFLGWSGCTTVTGHREYL
jgi:hypothetical protein